MNPPAKTNCAPTDENTITVDEMKALEDANHVVFVYPKKGIVVVDGFKRYKLPRGWKKA